MEIIYNIPSLLKTAFNENGVVLFNEATVVNQEDALAKLSAVGTPIVFPWKLLAGTYKSYDDNGEDIDVEMTNDFEMPRATLVNAQQSKLMNRTKTVASKGTVKEGYGMDDWELDIKGVLFNDSSHAFKTALEQKEQLLKWASIGDSIRVSGELFRMKEIYNIAIQDLKFQQLQGKPNLIPFTMKAYSDEPLEILLK